jgi:hypothetical protein
MPQRSRGKNIPPTIAPTDPAPVIAVVQSFQQSLIERLEDLSVPPTPQDIICETTAVARMAAIAGDLETAIKGFKAAGDLMGLGAATSTSTHNHLHLHQTAASMLDADDAALSDLIAAAKAKPVVPHVLDGRDPNPIGTQPRAAPSATADAEALLA